MIVIFVLGIGLLFSLNPLITSLTQVPTVTPSPEGTATPSATVPPAVPPGWTLALSDRLTSPSACEWDVGPDPSEPGAVREYTSRGYELSAPPNDGIQGLANKCPSFTDLYYQATMVIKAGMSGIASGAGLDFRSNSQADEYVYTFDNSGDWFLAKVLNNGSSVTEMAEGTSSFFRSGDGASNVLGVKAVGTNISLYVNGAYLGSVSDSSISSGLIGVEVDAGTYSLAQAVFSNVSVWEP